MGAVAASRLRAAGLALAALALGGCAVGGASPVRAPIEARTPVPDDALADRLGRAAPATLVAVDPARLGVAEAVVQTPYRAASGRDCRRLTDASGRPLGRVVCEAAGGRWRLGRVLAAGGVASRARPVVDAGAPLAPAIADDTDAPDRALR